MNPLKTKWLPQPFKKKINMVVVGVIFFSLFLDIDGQSLRLRGRDLPSIDAIILFLMILYFSVWQQPYVNVFKHVNIQSWKRSSKEGEVVSTMVSQGGGVNNAAV